MGKINFYELFAPKEEEVERSRAMELAFSNLYGGGIDARYRSGRAQVKNLVFAKPYGPTTKRLSSPSPSIQEATRYPLLPIGLPRRAPFENLRLGIEDEED